MLLKRIILHAYMVVSFCLWLIIPHYVTWEMSFVLLGVLSLFAVVFYSKTKAWWNIESQCGQRKKKVQSMKFGIVALLFLCCIPTGIAAIVRWNSAGIIATAMATFIFGLSMNLYANQQPDDKRQLWINLCLYGSLVAAGIAVIGAIYHLALGIYPFARLIVLSTTLGVCIMSYTTYQGPHYNIKYQAGWAAGCMLAVALTFSVNHAFGTCTPELHSYTVLSRSAQKAECVLDTGRTFSFDRCSTPKGCTDRIYLYEGWFHVTYLMPHAK